MGNNCILQHCPIFCCVYQSNICMHRTPQTHDNSHNEAPAKCCFSALLSSWLAFPLTKVCVMYVNSGSEKHVFLLILDRNNNSDNDMNSIHLYSWSLCCSHGCFKALCGNPDRPLSFNSGKNAEWGQTRMKSSSWWPAAETGQRGLDKKQKDHALAWLGLLLSEMFSWRCKSETDAASMQLYLYLSLLKTVLLHMQ